MRCCVCFGVANFLAAGEHLNYIKDLNFAVPVGFAFGVTVLVGAWLRGTCTSCGSTEVGAFWHGTR